MNKSISQKEFSELSGMSLSHVSNLEHSRANLSKEVLETYISVLNCSEAEANELQKKASFSNGLRKSPDPKSPNTPLQVMLAEFGDRLSPNGREAIRKILERETGEEMNALLFSSNQCAKGQKTPRRRPKRPSLHPSRFVEIALAAESARQKLCGNVRRVDVGHVVEKLIHLDQRFDCEVCEYLPPAFEGAFAVIVGHAEGHTLFVEQERYHSALNGVYFARHVIAHELGHHFLHPDKLRSDKALWLPPQELAKNTAKSFTSDNQIEQVVDNIEEVEAECFATLFLVPWTEFLKGTETKYLASDCGEQLDEVKRISRFMKIETVLNEFRAAIWSKGIRKHIVFGNAA
ncbi:helix-turn-helix domain-containing protein [Roseobacter sp. YSTF-M11]|uniref:Helix-turn-helix domain-containing protein n=1 Tax=Roseobacter insulae TaxID=2859783 RepID=A0A9X1JZY8_9RHOB|nr:helix-turn-helix domain-containing protein [Roseobacter insulae]